MKIIIIGANGFIGKNLLNYLSNKNYEVIGFDLKKSENKKCYTIDNIEELISSNFFKKTDLVVNCTGSSDVNFSYSNPLIDFNKNSYDVFKILDGIRKINLNIQFINISSGAVYGNVTQQINEDSDLDPESIYGFNKLISESICEEFNKIYGISTTSLRVFSAYGPYLKKQLFWDLYKKTENKKHITLFGSGNEYRDFIFIDDICLAIEKVINSSSNKNIVYNVASGQKIVIKNAVDIFYRLLNKDITYNFSGNNLEGYPKGTHANISKIKQIGFDPKYSLEDGLDLTIKWMIRQKP